MTTRMLIDARHREETRVAVVKGNQIEELDFESAEHKQLKGNIYLAKVTRVEPSLQAAFVEYGGNRHGFLAFSEIHPDYYQIPKADRDRLLAEEAEVAAEEAAFRDAEEEDDDEPAEIIRSDASDEENSDFIEVDTDTSVDTIDITEGEEPDLDANDGEDDDADDADNDQGGRGKRRGRGNRRGRGGRSAPKQSDNARAKRIALRRRYKIQDVIHRRQVLLVQVVKEERGNKGAALTTYLSLAGRYCVLMPNTSHGGGISRKISSASDRKRLKSIVSDLNLPSTMGCIIRTAGLSRTKTEIKRDFDYLARLWDEIRDRTLGGSAPLLIHTDSDLVKRAIRDIYNREISEVIVEGEDGYRAAKDFMKLLMPSHARRVKQYADPVPLFQRYGVEDQLSAMYHPVVQLKSGGYIVINPTEALVSIDINSGRSTKEHGIEQTALSTNLEAAKEIARQLRLRDMAGLVVIDFIDMESHSNSRKVERAMKEALKNDRARIQVGRISSFGLMEMSRQRLRTGVLEASTRECPHCEGTGLVRTSSSAALSALRLIEEEAASGNGSTITLSASQEAAFYVLNNKRGELAEIEDRYGVTIDIAPNEEQEGAKMGTSSSGPRPDKRVRFEPIKDEDDPEDEVEENENNADDDSDGEDRPRKKRRRGRRGGRGRRDRAKESNEGDNSGDSDSSDRSGNEPAEKADESSEGDAEPKDEKPKRTRRSRSKKKPETSEEAPAEQAEAASDTPDAEAEPAKPKRRTRRKKADTAAADEATEQKADEPSAETEAKPKTRTRRTKKVEPDAVEGKEEAAEAKPAKEPSGDKPKAKRAPAKRAKDKPAEEKSAEDKPVEEKPAANDAPSDASGDEGSDGEPRKGWWQRTFG